MGRRGSGERSGRGRGGGATWRGLGGVGVTRYKKWD
jgi:hypothetical protein